MTFSRRDRRRIRDGIHRLESSLQSLGGIPTAPAPDAPFQFRRFELKDDMEAGGEAEAYLLRRDSEGDLECDTDIVFTVSDPLDSFSGSGRDASDPENITDGTRGLCIHMHDGDYWEVAAVPLGGGVHWATLDETLEYDDTTGVSVTLDVGGTIENVLPSKTFQAGTLSGGTTVLIQKIDGEWYAVDWEREVQTVYTDFQVTGTTLQVKTRDIYVTPDGDESGWTTKHTGTECP